MILTGWRDERADQSLEQMPIVTMRLFTSLQFTASPFPFHLPLSIRILASLKRSFYANTAGEAKLNARAFHLTRKKREFSRSININKCAIITRLDAPAFCILSPFFLDASTYL